MRLRPAVILLGIVGVALAACGGGSKGGAMLPAAPSPTSSAAAKGTGKSVASFVITIPKATPTPAGARRPAYVSPATQSMTVSVLQGSTLVLSETAGLTATSPGCSTSLAGVTCTLTMNLDAGTYTASITTYDGTNGTGNALSTAQNLSFKVNANQNNVEPFSLSGIPAKIIAMAGNTSNTVDLVAQDADGNFIIGSGAPTFTTTVSGTIVATMTQPSAAPNTIVFTLPSPAPSPGTETISVTASYPSPQTNACAETGAVCTLAMPITASYTSGMAFMPNYENDNFVGFALPLTNNSETPAITVGGVNEEPYWGIALGSTGEVFSWGYYESDTTLVASQPPYTTETTTTNANTGMYDAYGYGAVASNGDLFIPNDPSGNGAVAMIAPPYTGTATQITSGMDGPTAVAVDSNSNLYVANGSNDSVTVYGSPYTSAPSATVTTAEEPYAVTVSGSKLFVGEDGAIQVFTLPLSSSSSPVATFTINGYFYSLATDPKGNLWAACEEDCGPSSISGAFYEFTTAFSTGASPAVSVTSMSAGGSACTEAVGIGFDAAGNLYVDDGYGGTEDGCLLEYSGTITSSSTPTYYADPTSLYYPWGLVISQPSLTVTP